MINANRNSAVGYRRRGGFGPVLNVSNCVNGDYTTFANGTPIGFDATSNGTSTHEAGTADEIAFVSGQKYIVTFDMVLNSGTAPVFNFRQSLGGSTITDEGAQLANAGANVFEFTVNWTGTGVLQFNNNSTATDFEITNLSVREVL